MAVATIVELLGDKETIRLQALGILLGLTKTHEEELQKCIAFSVCSMQSKLINVFNLINSYN